MSTELTVACVALVVALGSLGYAVWVDVHERWRRRQMLVWHRTCVGGMDNPGVCCVTSPAHLAAVGLDARHPVQDGDPT